MQKWQESFNCFKYGTFIGSFPRDGAEAWVKGLKYTDLRIWLIDDRLYSAILRSLEQTHYARMWFYMSD